MYGLDILVPRPRETTNTQCGSPRPQAVSFSTGNKCSDGTSNEDAEKSLSTSSSAHKRILFTLGETPCFTLGETSCKMKSNDELSSWHIALDMLARKLNCQKKKNSPNLQRRSWSRRFIRADIRTEQRLWFRQFPDSPKSSCHPPSTNERGEDDVEYDTCRLSSPTTRLR